MIACDSRSDVKLRNASEIRSLREKCKRGKARSQALSAEAPSSIAMRALCSDEACR
jgi:hypothetical protein